MNSEMIRSLYDIECKIYKHPEYTIYKFPVDIPKEDKSRSRISAIVLTLSQDKVSIFNEVRRYVEGRNIKKNGKREFIKIDKAFTAKDNTRFCFSFRKSKFNVYYLKRWAKRSRKFKIWNIKNSPATFTSYITTSSHNMFPMAIYWELSNYKVDRVQNYENTKAKVLTKVIKDIIKQEITKHGYSYEI